MGIETGFMRDRFAGVFGRARQLERLGSVEGCAEADFTDFLAVDLWEDPMLGEAWWRWRLGWLGWTYTAEGGLCGGGGFGVGFPGFGT